MSLARAVWGQIEVVHALALRETRTRFGRQQLGYLWALLEPALMILTFYVLFQIAHRRVPNGMDTFGFTATGLIPYYLFSNSVNRVSEAINGNKALLFYPHVHPLDLVLARSVLEFATWSGVFLVLMGTNVIARQELAVHSPLLIVAGLALAGLLGTTLGLVFCGLSLFSNSIERARGPLMRPFFWVSGVFFTANEAPEATRDYLLLNPVLHVVELVRGGWYPSYDPVNANPQYVLIWILGLAGLGLSLERVVRRRIEVT